MTDEKEQEGMSVEGSVNESFADEAPETDENKSGRILGTSLVAGGFVVMIFVLAALVFLAIGSLVQGDWVMFVIAIVVSGLLLWIMGRVARVAVNQNKMT